MTTALVYVRQSRHKDYERTVSPAVQRDACAALPDVKACDAVEVFEDLDVSGGKRKRRGYDALLARIHDDDVEVVAAYDQSRLARSVWIWAEFQDLVYRAPRLKVVYVHGSFDRSTLGRFAQVNIAAADQLLREMTGDKIRDAKRHQAKAGLMVGAVPAGYIRKDGKVDVDEAAAAVVRRVFADYAAGDASTQDIARRLNAEGVRLASFRTAWRRDTVAQMLGNPAYIALTYTERRSKRLGEQLAAQWPALVDRPTWDAVQAKLTRFHRKGGRREQATGKERAYAFQGLLRCLNCGGPMHCHWLKDRAYYQCRGERANGCRGVRDDDARTWAQRLMEHIEREAEIMVTFAAPTQRERPHVSLAKIDETIERLGQRFEWGDIDADAYRAKLTDYRALRAEAAVELERTQTATSPRTWPANLVETWEQATPRSKRGLLATFFERLDVEGGRIVGAQIRPALAGLAEILGAYRGSSPGGIRGDSDGTALRVRFG